MDLLTRNAAAVARERLSTSSAVIIEGARQVGKSTLAAQLADDDAVVANLDVTATRDAARADPEGFVAQAGSRQLVIDELQRQPELTLAIKAAIDADRRPGRFLITGSSSLLRVRGTADSLAGRAARIRLFGLSGGEGRGLIDDLASVVRTSGPEQLVEHRSDLTRADYAELLGVGAYPEARTLSPRSRRAWFDDYLDAVLGRDLPELRREIRPGRALSILRTLAGRQSSELVRERLGVDAGVPATTLPGYLDLLADVGLIATVAPWTPNLSKREIGRHKTVVLDSGLAVRLARMSPDQLATFGYGEAMGAFLESFVTAELLKQRTWSASDHELFHYRDRAGTEVDLVLEYDDGSVLGIEVKAATSYNRAQFSNLATLRDRVGERFIAGIVLGTASHGYRYADRLVGAPISALWHTGS